MRWILIILFFVSCKNEDPCNYIEDYYPFIYKAQTEYRVGNFEASKKLYEKAFEKCTCIRPHHYQYANTLESLKSNSIIEAVKEAISKGCTLDKFSDTTKYKFLTSLEEWEHIKNSYTTNRNKYLETVNFDLRDSIKLLSQLDQEIRTRKDLPDVIRRKFMIENDRKVQERLWNLFLKHGYLGIQQIGGDDIDGESASVTAILLHTPEKERFEKWIPFLIQAIKDGKCYPEQVAYLIDQHQVYNGNPVKIGVIYGSEVRDVRESNKLRHEIGLPPIRNIKEE